MKNLTRLTLNDIHAMGKNNKERAKLVDLRRKQIEAKNKLKREKNLSLYENYCFSIIISNSKRLTELSKKDAQKYSDLVALVNKKMSLYNNGLRLIDSCHADFQTDLLAGLLPIEAEILELIENMNELTDKKIA